MGGLPGMRGLWGRGQGGAVEKEGEGEGESNCYGDGHGDGFGDGVGWGAVRASLQGSW